MCSKATALALQDCLDALIDYRGKTPKKAAAGIPLLTAKVVKGGRVASPNEYIAAEDFEAWMTRGLPKIGDVVMTTEAPLGEVGQIQRLPVALAQRIVTLRGKSGVLHNDYLLYALQSEPVQAQLLSRASGTTVIGIKQSELRKVTLELPLYERQVEIAGVMKALDDRMDLLRQTNITLESIAQALFKSWFIDFDPVREKQAGREPEGMGAAAAALFPAEFEASALGLIPKGWRVGTLADLAELNSRSWSAKQHPQAIKYIDLSNVKDNRVADVAEYSFEEAPSRARRVLRDGDTIVGTVRPGNRSYAYIESAEPGLTGSTGFAVLSPRSPLQREFVYLAATDDANILRLANLADGGAYPAVRPEAVLATPVVIATEDVPKAFSAYASALFRKQAMNNATADSLADLRDTLLPRLISGKLHLPDPTAQAAAAALAEA